MVHHFFYLACMNVLLYCMKSYCTTPVGVGGMNKMLKFYVKFKVMGKVLSGKLLYPVRGQILFFLLRSGPGFSKHR